MSCTPLCLFSTGLAVRFPQEGEDVFAEIVAGGMILAMEPFQGTALWNAPGPCSSWKLC